MTIQIFLNVQAIAGKEDNFLKNDLIKTFNNNTIPVKTIDLISCEKGKLVNLEIENLHEEKQVAKNISQITYNGLRLKPQVYHEIKIENLPECTQEELKKECEKTSKCLSVKITKYKYAYVKLESRELAENLITNLNNQIWRGKELQVELSQKNPNKRTEKNNLESPKKLDNTQVKADLSSLGEFYQKKDYELVTQNLKIFISEICKCLSNPPDNKQITQIEQPKTNTDNSSHD
ncbi:RNA recognition motif domain-containing protein [Nostoc sp. FACHB-973]|nr:RNA recognition motif domain-containing protein [Nostoc sp. FACHB-973]